MKRKFIIVAALIFLTFVVATFFRIWNRGAITDVLTSDSGSRTIQLAGKTIQVSIADTPEERAKGLSSRSSLSQGEGMLFVFDSDAKYQFWMKDMSFPIDILWISYKGEVVDIRENVSPETYPDIFTPNSPVRYVLELPAGFARAYSVKMGDIVGF
ncbi:MAG: DUF192 domain-containing protein [bacterium]|nr:DUF192 domain-containing protein [bacterium]